MNPFDTIETPSIVIDMAVVRRNLRHMAERVGSFGCALRPHIKTHKIPELARLALEYGASGITCAKVSEAEVMAGGGVGDIFIAYPLVGDFRIRRAVALAKKIRLIAAVDSLEGARALSGEAAAQGVTLETRLEVDTGLKRTGAEADRAVALAKEIARLPGLRLTGIFTFRGLMLEGKPVRDREAAGREEGRLLVEMANQMRSAGLDIRDVSGGSTPTGEFVATVPGVTEVRPGTYIFNDVMQVMEGSCAWEDCAAVVLATVVSVHEGHAVIDGGSKTFGADIAVNAPPFHFPGYAVARGNPDVVLTRANEEHGILTSLSVAPLGLTVGQQIAMVPLHVCTTVNLHNDVWLMEDGGLRKVPVAARGMLV